MSDDPRDADRYRSIRARCSEQMCAALFGAEVARGILTDGDFDRAVDAQMGEHAMPPSAPVPPVDRSQRTLTDGSPVTEDHRELKPNGQQKGYVVLSAEERAKGFVRPVRRTYTHKVCGADTTMALALAETYARDPEFYSGTFCSTCGKHFPLDQFVWTYTDEQVGS